MALAGSGDHLCFEDALVELEIDLLGQGPDVADVYPVLMQEILDALAVD